MHQIRFLLGELAAPLQTPNYIMRLTSAKSLLTCI